MNHWPALCFETVVSSALTVHTLPIPIKPTQSKTGRWWPQSSTLAPVQPDSTLSAPEPQPQPGFRGKRFSSLRAIGARRLFINQLRSPLGKVAQYQAERPGIPHSERSSQSLSTGSQGRDSWRCRRAVPSSFDRLPLQPVLSKKQPFLIMNYKLNVRITF